MHASRTISCLYVCLTSRHFQHFVRQMKKVGGIDVPWSSPGRCRNNSALVDIRFRPSIVTPLAVLGWRSAFHATPYGPLRPDVTSCIKPEIHKISQRRQRRTEPWPQRIRAKKIREDRSSGSRDILADRQTDTHTDKLIAILRSAAGAEY